MFRINEAIQNGDNLFRFNQDNQRMEFAYKDDLQEEYNQLWATCFPDLNLDPSTPQGQIITSEIQNDLATISNMENMLNSFFFGGTGIALDMWAWNLFRVTRKKGVASSVDILITGVPNTVITDDFTVSDGTYDYRISEAVTIPNTANITVKFNCTEVNTFIPPANTINRFVTVIDGVETVNNPSMGVGAILPETDDQFFTRCATFGATATNSSFRSIMANVGQVQGVSKLAGAENFTDTPVVFKDVTLPPHSITICVQGGDINDIALAIQKSRSTGCNMNGTTEVIIVDFDSNYTYRFYRPTSVEIKVNVEVKINQSSPTNWETVIKNNIIDFVNSMNIASLVTQPNLARHLYRNVSSFEVVDVQFSEISGVLGYEDLQLKLNEVLAIDPININVVQV